MKQPRKEIIIISLGGSLIVPDEIDVRLLRDFTQFIHRQLRFGKKRFFIISGGGSTARRYRDAAAAVTRLTKDDLDWIGIHSTRLNGHLLRTVFRAVAHPRIVTDPLRDPLPRTHDVLVAAGWRPGWSTDYVAVQLARRVGAKVLVNLSNIEAVYERDPRKHPDAKKFTAISWKEFRRIVGNVWDPGMNVPFDPVASRLAEKIGMKVIITNGKDLANFKQWITTGRGDGTVIS